MRSERIERADRSREERRRALMQGAIASGRAARVAWASFRRRVVDAMRPARERSPSRFSASARRTSAPTQTRRASSTGVLMPIRTDVWRPADRPRSASSQERRHDAAPRLPRRRSSTPKPSARSCPTFADHAVPDKLTRALLVCLHEGGVLFGVAGLERRAVDPEFSPDDVRRLEQLAPFVVAGARSQIAYDELTREAAAIRALGKIKGTLFVVDRDREDGRLGRRPRARRRLGDGRRPDREGALVDATEQSLAGAREERSAPHAAASS